MKKIILLIIGMLSCIGISFCQPNILIEAPLNNQTTTQVRAPNGTSAHGFQRACALVLQSELVNIPVGTTLTTFGFTLTAGTSVVPVSGSFTVYLQNTNDLTYSKGTVFATAITGMTTVYNGLMTIPLSAGATSINLTLTTPFTYTGGGLYVAYDWISGGPYSPTPATYLSESTALNPGCASGASAVSSPTALATSVFRPSFLFGAVNTNSNDIQVLGVEVPGRVANSFNTPHAIKAVVKNASNVTQNSIAVNLNVAGANLFSNVQTIPSLSAGGTTTVTFAPFNPLIPGANNVSVSVASDQNNSNNLQVYSQSVTCSEMAQNPAVANYTSNSVGFGTGSGIISWNYLNPVTSTLTGLRGAVSTNTDAVGNQSWGVLLNAAGAIIATTNTITISSPMLGNFQAFNFTAPQNLAPGTQYFLGFAQPANPVAYYPMGTKASSYLPPNLYATCALAGGAMTPLAQNFGYFGIEAIFASTVNVAVSSSTIVCGNQAIITASSTTNYSWSTGATSSSISVSPTLTTSYTVIATNTLGCSSTKVSTVTVNPLSLTVTSTQSFVPCGTSVTLAALGSGNFLWNTGSTNSSIVITPTSNLTYSVSLSNTLGCVTSSFVPIVVNPLQVIPASSSPSVCAGNSLTISATGATSYFWITPTGSLTGQSFVANPATNSTYTVVGTNTAGCSSLSLINITVNSFTNLSVSSTSVVACLGDLINIIASGAATYTWSSLAGIFNTPAISTTLAASSPITVSGTDLLGCVATKTINAIVNSVNLSVSTNTAICSGSSAQLTASGANSYTWSGTVLQQSITVSPTLTTTYSVAGTSTNGCVGNGLVTVTVNPTPTITAVANRTLMCKNELNILTATGANTYSWLAGGTGPTIAINPTVTGTVAYSVTGTDNNGCSKNSSITIKINTCTGLESIKPTVSNLKIYPNPTEGQVTIAVEDLRPNMNFQIYNLFGELVFEQYNLMTENTVNIEKLGKGVYMIYLFDAGNKVASGKIIKQ